MNTNAVRVAVTGAAGQIGYSLLFRIASGAMFGPNHPVILHLIEIEPALPALQGVVMELDDCAFPLLKGVVPTANLDEGFRGVNAAKAGHCRAAIPLLEGAVERDKQSADALNLLAYATRKNGDPAKSIPIYERALAIDPKHKDAHEYIGEAYLALGNLPKAKEHLARLDSLCFITCSQYRDLKKAVQEHETKGGRPATSGR